MKDQSTKHMKNKSDIEQMVEDTLDSVSGIGTVKVPPFFKEKVLNKMVVSQNTIEKEEGIRFLSWFTPIYQAAALVAFVILNAIALFSTTTDSYGDNVDNFASVYGLSETSTDSYFYKN